MSYNINWNTIIGEYEENPREFIKKFLAEHPIDWSLFDTSFIEEGKSFAPEFAKQQGWNNAGVDGSEWERIYRIIEHIVANDATTPEVALLKIANEEKGWLYWENSWMWKDIVIAILDNPNVTKEVFRAICMGLSYDFRGGVDGEVFRHVFEHHLVTDEILDCIAEMAYGPSGEEPEKIMEYAPNELLERFFENIAIKPWGAYSYELDVLMQSPNISQELFERAVNYVLSVDKKRMIQDDFIAFDGMYETIDKLLTNPKTSMEYADKLRELRKQVSVWDEEEYSKL